MEKGVVSGSLTFVLCFDSEVVLRPEEVARTINYGSIAIAWI